MGRNSEEVEDVMLNGKIEERMGGKKAQGKIGQEIH